MSELPINTVRVGISVLIKNGNTYLLGKRKSKHGPGTWAQPGGHLEIGESWEDCARREVKEETGLDVGNITFGTVTNDIFSPEKHYITIFLIAEYIGGEPQNLEPEKCEGWEWFPWNEFPDPVFLPTKNVKATDWNPDLV